MEREQNINGVVWWDTRLVGVPWSHMNIIHEDNPKYLPFTIAGIRLTTTSRGG